jgi:NADH-quinone oxidoreductase subunit M
MGIFPDQTIEYSQIIAILGVINILYGAVLAFVQKDLKMVLAYSSISHMGIVLLGLAALNYSGLQGAIFQSISHGLIAALLFFIVGALYERTQTTEIPDLGGLAKTMPFISGIFLIAAMANVALPGTSGFIGEFLAFKGLFEIYPWIAAVGVVGIILTAVYMLRATLNTTFGPAQDRWADVKDARGFEVIPMVILVGLILLLGVYPNFLVEALDISVETIINSLRAGIGG